MLTDCYERPEWTFFSQIFLYKNECALINRPKPHFEVKKKVPQCLRYHEISIDFLIIGDRGGKFFIFNVYTKSVVN